MEKSASQKELPTDAELQSAMAAVGWEKLLLDHKQRTAQLTEPNMRLDLGGIAQGYAADLALQAMKAAGNHPSIGGCQWRCGVR